MQKAYPKFKRFEIDKIYEKLPKKEKDDLEKYIKYRIARGLISETKQKDVRRIILQLRVLFQKDLINLNLEKLREMLSIINSSYLGDITKNEVKTHLKNYLKWKFNDWSKRFSDLEDIKIIKGNRIREITPQNLPTKQDIEKLMKHENKMFWKAFLITQYEGGLRTKETRYLKWGDIAFNIDGDISEVSLISTKNKKKRTIFLKEASFYLQKLKVEQENTKTKGDYIFHSKNDFSTPVDKWVISKWFTNLSKKALGKPIWNYLLRHARATELYKLSKLGKISKDTAQNFMGHSKDMEDVYTHLDTSTLKKIIKDQVYKLEDLPEERKHELEKDVEELKKQIKSIKDSENAFSKKFLQFLTILKSNPQGSKLIAKEDMVKLKKLFS